MGKTAIVSGYATLDYAARLAAPLQGPQTATVEALADNDWPRAGGAALYASRRIAASGHRATALVTLGQDSNGTAYLEACRASGIDTGAVSRSAQARTPWCMLLYHDIGSYTCLIDRGGAEQQPLTDAQISMLSQADLVCIAAGSAATSAALLDRISPEVPLAWIAKRDPISFPDWLTVRLARRADLIFCNASERPMVDSARTAAPRAGQAVIETRGADGVLLHQSGREAPLACEPVEVQDATGAGDTLAGEVLAALLSGESDLRTAVRRGIDAVRDLLLGRAVSDRQQDL